MNITRRKLLTGGSSIVVGAAATGAASASPLDYQLGAANALGIDLNADITRILSKYSNVKYNYDSTYDIATELTDFIERICLGRQNEDGYYCREGQYTTARYKHFHMSHIMDTCFYYNTTGYGPLSFYIDKIRYDLSIKRNPEILYLSHRLISVRDIPQDESILI